MYGFFLNTLDPTVINPDFSGRLELATTTLVRGVLTVFAVLCIIWAFLVLLRVFIHDLPKKRDARRAAKKAVAAPVSEVSAPIAAQDDAALIAAITAAIAAYTADDADVSFRVVSFRRVN